MSETSTPYTPAFTSTTVAENEAVSLADDIKKYDMVKLIEFLKGQDLGLSKIALKSLEKENVTGHAFLKMTKQDFQDIDIKAGPVLVLVNFAKECKEKKLKAFSSYLSLNEVLVEYDLGDGIDSIPLFKPQIYEIQDENKVFKRCMKEILGRLRSYGTLQADSLEAMRNEYVVALLHASIHIVMDITDKELSMRPQYEIVGEKS